MSLQKFDWQVIYSCVVSWGMKSSQTGLEVFLSLQAVCRGSMYYITHERFPKKLYFKTHLHQRRLWNIWNLKLAYVRDYDAKSVNIKRRKLEFKNFWRMWIFMFIRFDVRVVIIRWFMVRSTINTNLFFKKSNSFSRSPTRGFWWWISFIENSLFSNSQL